MAAETTSKAFSHRKLFAATAERVKLNRAIIGKLHQRADSTDGFRQPAEMTFYNLFDQPIRIPRASVTEMEEVLNDHQYWSDDESRHTRIDQTEAVGSRQLVFGVRPATATALKSRIERQRRMRAQSNEANSNAAEATPSVLSSPRQSKTESNRSQLKKTAKRKAVKHSDAYPNEASDSETSEIEYLSPINPNVTYRKGHRPTYSSESWSRSWMDATWLQEFSAQKPQKYLSKVKETRRVVTFSEGSALVKSRGVFLQDGGARIYDPAKSSTAESASTVNPSGSIVKLANQDKGVGPQFPANRFRRFWSETVSDKIYSPFDDTVPPMSAESNSGGASTQPIVMATAGPRNAAIESSNSWLTTAANYQLRRNYGYI